MATYSNGYIPDSLLVTFDSGTNTTDGKWYHKLSPGTLSKHRALVALAKKNTGRDLKISDGWGAYRPYNIQELARKLYGTGAAVPGTSSHGGFWEGKQTLAIDYGNWGGVYGWDRDAFYRDVRAVGLEPDLISPRRGYPDEPWHVVDLVPWASAPTPTPSTPSGEEEEDEMSRNIMYRTTDTKAKIRAAVVNDTSGLWIEFTANDAGPLNDHAKAFNTGDAMTVSSTMFRVARDAAEAVRTGK